MMEIKGFDVSRFTEVSRLIDSYSSIGFQATQLVKAKKIIWRMQSDRATIFLSFTSNLVSSGLREIFADLVRKKKVSVIITSVGSIEEDLMKTMHPFQLGSFDMDDVKLHRKGINRIGNILVPNRCYQALEDTIQSFLEDMNAKKNIFSPRELILELGNTLDDERSILYWASRNSIPIFCPGITDGAFGLQMYFFKQKHPEFVVDVTADMRELADIVLKSKKTGAIILGGGIAKHYTIGANILREGLDCAVYVSTATELDGSLSGARPKEAISWSKLREESNSVFIHADATIVFPLLAACMK